MGEAETRIQKGGTAEEHLEYHGLVCRLIENGRYETLENKPCESKAFIEHYFKGRSARTKLADPEGKYSWALEHRLLEETLIEDKSGKETRVVTFTEQAKKLLYLSYIASQHRKISTFEMESIKRSTLDFFVETSGLPAEVKRDLGELYKFAVEQGFLQEPQDHVNGDGTETCQPTPRLPAYLKELGLPDESQETPPQAALEQPGEATRRLPTDTSRFLVRKGGQDPAAFLGRVNAKAEADPIIQRLAERRKSGTTVQPADNPAPAEEVVDLGLQDVIDDNIRAKRMRAQLAERRTKENKGLLGRLRDTLGS